VLLPKPARVLALVSSLLVSIVSIQAFDTLKRQFAYSESAQRATGLGSGVDPSSVDRDLAHGVPPIDAAPKEPPPHTPTM